MAPSLIKFNLTKGRLHFFYGGSIKKYFLIGLLVNGGIYYKNGLLKQFIGGDGIRKIETWFFIQYIR